MQRTLLLLLALVTTGCIGAYQTAPVSPVAAGDLVPRMTDPDAGLVALDPTFGAGASKAQIETRMVDVATGKVVLVTADRREAAFGMFGGDSEEHLREAVSDSARDFVKYLARLKASGSMSSTAGATGGAAVTAALAAGGTWRDADRRAVLKIA